MKPTLEFTWQPLLATARWLALAALVSGCKTTFRTVDEHFMARPANYRQVQILPVWFEGAGNLDRTFTTNELQALCRQAGNNLVDAAQRRLGAKGYQVVGPVQIWRTNEIPPRLAAEIGPPLEIVRGDFSEGLLRPYPAAEDGRPLTIRTNTTLGFFRYFTTSNWKRAAMEPNPFHYQMAPALTNVLRGIGATNAQAVLLVDSRAFFESPRHEAKRTAYNWTGGGLIAITEMGVNVAAWAGAALIGAHDPPPPFWIDPFWHSNNSLQHNVALVDVRTREVLWLNRRDFRAVKQIS